VKLARALSVIFLFLVAVAVAWSQANPLALLEAGKADEALQALNIRVQKNSGDAQAYNLIGRVYFQLQRWDDAIRAAEKSTTLDPQNNEYHQWLARAYGEKADVAGPVHALSLVRKVKAEFEKAVALDDTGKNISARADLAEFYTEAPSIMGGDKTRARQLGDFIMKYDPALAHYIYARLEEKQNGKSKAEQEFKAAIDAAGKTAAHYWVNLASFYRRQGRLAEMESAINKALVAPRQNSIFLFDGGSTLLEAGRNYPLAVNLFHRYLASNQLGEDAPAFQAHYLLGQLLEKQGDRRGAALEYQASLALASQFQLAQDALAKLSR
jgi:tetratricopeptide (TPR) repeat protein